MAPIAAHQGAAVGIDLGATDGTFRRALRRFWKAVVAAQTFNALNQLTDSDLARMGIRRKDLGRVAGLDR